MNQQEMSTGGKQVPIGSGPEAMEDLMAVLPLSKVPALQENVEQMGRYLMQMGQLVAQMQRRLDEMEERQAQVTISHAEAKRLQALIRGRADELCRKYNLQDKDSPKIFRAAIKKDLLKRFLVKDLHDLPAAALGRAEALVDSWVNIRLAMERRVST